MNPSPSDSTPLSGQPAPPPPIAPGEYFTTLNGEVVGPLDIEEIRHQLRKGVYQEVDSIWAEGWEDWKPISILKDRNTPPPPPSPMPLPRRLLSTL